MLHVIFAFRPQSHYRSLAEQYDAQYGSPPEKSWSDTPVREILNADGFVDEQSEKAGMYQSGNPDLGGDPDSLAEGAERSRSYAKLCRRLEQLDHLMVHIYFQNLDDQSESSTVSLFKAAQDIEWLNRALQHLSWDLLAFFADRLKVHLRETGARHDLIDAVFAAGGAASVAGGSSPHRGEGGARSAPGEGAEEKSPSPASAPRASATSPRGGEERSPGPAAAANDDLLMIVRRVEALGKFLDCDDGANLLVGYRRAANILRAEEKKDGEGAFNGAPDHRLIEAQGLPEEKALFHVMRAAEGHARDHVEREDFEGAMRALAELRPAVDAFFDKVTVNADDPALRANRLKLLNMLRRATLAVADFSKIEG